MNLETLSAFLLTLLYFQASFSKNLTSTPKGLQQKFIKKLPLFFYKIVIFLVIVLEFLAPLLIVYSTINEEYKVYGLYSLYALIVFTILATILYHKPMSGSFYSHLSIIGGLLALLIVFQK